MAGRVLIVVHGYPPTARAGAEIHAWRSARGLTEQGLEVRVLAFERHAAGPLSGQDSAEDGVVVRRLSGDCEWGQRDPFRASYDSDGIAAAMREMMTDRRPHLVYLFSGYLMSSSIVRTASSAGVPVVINLTDYWWFCHQINLRRPDGARCDGPSLAGCARCHAEGRRRWRLPGATMPGLATRFWELAPRLRFLQGPLGVDAVRLRAETLADVLGEVSAFIAPSQYLADFYQRHGIEPRRIHLIRQGLEVGAHPARVPSDELRIAFFGQLKAHKGVMTLLEAWSLLSGPKPRTLALWGSSAGEEEFGARVRKTIAGLPGVEWRGAFAPHEVWHVLASADVVVVPSLWVENSPNVILEAQAMRVPVVGSNIGGIAELVRHDQNGLLFETGSARDLARQLQRLLDDSEFAARLGRNAPPVRTVAEEEKAVLEVFRRFLPERR
jgi:glycosyltransferase involved in cell wall biosynthesis